MDLACGLFFSSSPWTLVSAEPTLSPRGNLAEDTIQKPCRRLVHRKEDRLSPASAPLRQPGSTGLMPGRRVSSSLDFRKGLLGSVVLFAHMHSSAMLSSLTC